MRIEAAVRIALHLLDLQMAERETVADHRQILIERQRRASVLVIVKARVLEPGSLADGFAYDVEIVYVRLLRR